MTILTIFYFYRFFFISNFIVRYFLLSALEPCIEHYVNDVLVLVLVCYWRGWMRLTEGDLGRRGRVRVTGSGGLGWESLRLAGEGEAD